MRHRGGYKYQLAEDESFQTSIHPKGDITSEAGRIKLSASGKLSISEGYAWDGPSGPVIDRKTNMRASLAHDALYQLMREARLPYYNWPLADMEFGRIIVEDGAWGITATIDLLGLKLANGVAARPENRKKVYEV